MGVLIHKRKYRPSTTSSEEFDEESGSCSIEFFYSSKDNYRVGPGTKMPVTWPYDQTRASENARGILREIQQDFEKVLSHHKISLLRAKVEKLGAMDSDEEPKDTLILVTEDDNSSISWRIAATEIQELIDTKILHDSLSLSMSVEIRNETLMYKDTSSAIQKDSPAHKAFLSIEDDVLTEVNKYCADQLTSISYHMRGPSTQDQNRKPTLIVSLHPRSRSIWPVIQSQVIKSLESAGTSFGTQLHIEFVPGRPCLLVSREMLPSNPRLYRVLEEFPTNGSSIGPRGAQEAGSLGIFANFDATNGIRYQVAVTCHHVTAFGDPENRVNNDLNGIGLNGAIVDSTIRVDYPAPFDAEATNKALELEISKGSDTDGAKAQVSRTIQKHREAGGIGRVIHSSGISRTRNSGDNRMNWSIIQLHDQTISRKNKPMASTLNMAESWNDQIAWNISPADVVSEIGIAEQNQWVCKKGRTSAFTCGEINAMKSHIVWPSRAATKETIIDPCIGGEAVVQPGDSGCMVLNEKRQWVGLMMGGDKDVGILLKAQDIIQDVEEATGGTISLT